MEKKSQKVELVLRIALWSLLTFAFDQRLYLMLSSSGAPIKGSVPVFVISVPDAFYLLSDIY